MSLAQIEAIENDPSAAHVYAPAFDAGGDGGVGEIMTTDPDTGAMRANGSKPLLHLVPPEVLKLALPTRFHGFIDWFHERGSSRTLETVVIDALDAFQLPAGVLGYAEVLTYGARKYAPRNWEKGLKFSNVYDSAIRHALKMQYEAIDAIADGGSGLPHRSHYAWNVIACYVFTLRGRTDLDDRPALELK